MSSQFRPTFSQGLLTPQPSKSIKQILRVGPGFLTRLLRPKPAIIRSPAASPESTQWEWQRSPGRGLRRTARGKRLQRCEARGAESAVPGRGQGVRRSIQPIPEQPPPRPPKAERGGGARRRRQQRRRRRLPWGGMERGGGSGAEWRQPRRCRAAGAAARLPVLPPARAPSR